MKKQILFTSALLLFISSIAKSQDLNNYEKHKDNAVSGYIITNDNAYKQVLLFDGLDKDNSEYIVYMNNMQAPVQKFSIYDIKEYGYNNKIYETVERNDVIVFMQRINTSEPFLYYYKEKGVKEFYLKTNDQFELLTSAKAELKNTLNSKYQECDIAPQITKVASYNKKRLQSISKRLADCDNHKIAYFKIGIMGGANFQTLTLNERAIVDQNELEKVSVILAYYGIFLDIPISETNLHFSFRPELEFSRAKEYKVESENTDFSFGIQYITTNLFIRYNNLKPTNSLFVDFGFIYSSLSILEAKDDSFYGEDEMKNINKSIYGLGAGIGVDIHVMGRNTINFGIRGSYLISDNKMPDAFSIGVNVAFSF